MGLWLRVEWVYSLGVSLAVLLLPPITNFNSCCTCPPLSHPPREQFCNRYCGNKHTHRWGCIVRTSVNTVHLQGGAAIFPGYSFCCEESGVDC